jgi:hypothetical protein
MDGFESTTPGSMRLWMDRVLCSQHFLGEPR